MVTSPAATVEDYLASLPEDRRLVMEAIRKFVGKNVARGYSEMMSWGMICWGIPLEDYPDTYNGQPICVAALAAQKNYYALYLMGAYGEPVQEHLLRDAFAKAGKKLDMGKSCLRFRSLDDLVLDAIAAVLRSTPPAALIAKHEAAHRKTKGKRK